MIEDEPDEAVMLVMVVNGAILSGRLIPREAWASRIINPDDPQSEPWVRRLLKMPTAPSALDADDGFDGEAEVSGRFAHLAQVEFVLGNFRSQIGSMRIRTDSVSAWTTGELPRSLR
ncbi:hypothetical protein ACUN7V_02385 [Quadrisphaera oryzae]|uniref:hypothetical protein n=1 Tax=Quadrisphaera TaxID=317661 RepID=UPI00164516D1|nr:hypothetical protein [Quadrisphaera sp. RL12-1S]MBC3761084.1 hypothetical protein [Quadrisphaera sp. RL12-1S]